MPRGHGRLGGGKKRVKKTSGMKKTEFEKEQRADAKRRAKPQKHKKIELKEFKEYKKIEPKERKKYKKIEPREGFKEFQFGPRSLAENVSPKPPKFDPSLTKAQDDAVGKAWLKHKLAQISVDSRRSGEQTAIRNARWKHEDAARELKHKKKRKKRGKK
jgi:hypothetical protein